MRLKDWELKRVVVGFGTEDAYQLQGCPEEMGRDHRKKVLRGNRGVLNLLFQLWFLTKIIKVKLIGVYPPIEKMDASVGVLASCVKLSLSTNMITK